MGQVGASDDSVTVTDSCLGTTTNATILPPYSDSGGYWISPIGDSHWDSVDAGSHGCNATYQATFTLPSDAISSSLSVTELADNSTNVSLNGNQPFITGNVPGQCVRAYDGPPVSGTTASGLVPGVNTLTFNVDNCYPALGQNPTGLDFVATVTYGGGGGGGGGAGGTPPPPISCALGAQSRNISGTPVPLKQVGDQAFSGTVARFLGRGAGLAVDPRNYYATIDWGDGSTYSNVQPAGPPGNFTVDGSHTYPSSSFPKGYNVVVRLYYQPSGCPAPAKATLKFTGFGLFAPPPQDPLKPLWLLGAVATTAGTAPLCVTVVGCLALGGSVVGIGVAAKDPPDRHFTKVFRPQRFPLPRMTVHCGHLGRAACGRLKQAWKSYDKAVSRVASLSEAIGVTVDRRSGARAAHNAKAQARQAKALQKYQTLWEAAVTSRQAVGLRLGAELTLDGRNTQFSAAQIARGERACPASTDFRTA